MLGGNYESPKGIIQDKKVRHIVCGGLSIKSVCKKYSWLSLELVALINNLGLVDHGIEDVALLTEDAAESGA